MEDVRKVAVLRWLALYALNLLAATFGVALTGGILLNVVLRPFLNHETIRRVSLNPYYPVPILLALMAGTLSYIRFRGSYRYWVWIVPALYLVNSMMTWSAANSTGFSDAAAHFFGNLRYPSNQDQLESTIYLYLATAYSIGALIHKLIIGKDTVPPQRLW